MARLTPKLSLVSVVTVSGAVWRANVSFDQDQSFAGDRLGELSKADFVARWREIVGEPPSIMLDDRHEMIAILVAASGVPASISELRDDVCPLVDYLPRRAA